MIDVEVILKSGDFNLFLGRQEDDFFEAKGSHPYDLGSAQGRYELAKDVSAFANAHGGCIVIGLSHKKSDTENTEEVTGLDLLTKEAFLPAQIYGIASTHIWPPVTGLIVNWFPSRGDSSVGLGAILIPKQNEDSKLFLITKVVEDGASLKENVFGIARRIKSHNVPLTGKELARLIKEGRASTAQRLTRIEEKLDRLLGDEGHDDGDSATSRLHERLKRARETR